MCVVGNDTANSQLSVGRRAGDTRWDDRIWSRTLWAVEVTRAAKGGSERNLRWCEKDSGAIRVVYEENCIAAEAEGFGVDDGDCSAVTAAARAEEEAV